MHQYTKKMNNGKILFKEIAAGGVLLASMPVSAQYSPTPPFTGHIGKTVETTQTAYPQHNPKAPAGAPNIVWILLDDTGFGVSSAFGGLVETPTFDYLSQQGLRFNNFHTASISAATRACLLTGRNHHSAHMGRFNDDQYGAPGYDTYLPMEHGTIAEVLRENGYATLCVGKYNGTPDRNGSNAGPFNRWPTNRGFDHYFGFNAASGAEDQWHPMLYRDTHRVPDDSLGQLCITRFVNEAINYIADQKSAAPEQPFFLYFSPGTAHTPFHTSKEWVDKYHGKFDKGWDEYARQTLKNQLIQGIVPKGTKLPIPNKDKQDWSVLSADDRKLYTRQMEVFAGFMSQCDYEIGRIVNFIREIGQLDNTLIIVALGDNGASGEGMRTGGREMASVEAENDFIAKELKKYDYYGDERTQPFYSAGWAQACNTPFRYHKKWADYEGGTHDGLIVFYPKVIKEAGGIRTQYTHVTDILPTTLELSGTKYPEKINGYTQTPVEGTSFADAVTSADNNVPEHKHIQYYELNSSYALYKDGWKVQFPNGKLNNLRGFFPDTDVHLYNLKEDFNESNDLAKKYPEKVSELLADFEKEAWKYNVYPLKSGKTKVDPNYPNPQRPHYDIYVGARNYGEYPYFDGTQGKPYTISVYISESNGRDNGVLMSQRGFALYMLDGVPVFAVRDDKKIVASRAVPAGKSVVKAEVRHKGKTPSSVRLYINDELVGSCELKEKLNMSGKSNFIQVGRQWGLPVNNDYKSPFTFTGKIFKGTVDIKQ